MQIILPPEKVEPTVDELTRLLRLYEFVANYQEPQAPPNFAKEYPNLTSIFACIIANNHFLDYQGIKLKQLLEKDGYKLNHP